MSLALPVATAGMTVSNQEIQALVVERCIHREVMSVGYSMIEAQLLCKLSQNPLPAALGEIKLSHDGTPTWRTY